MTYASGGPGHLTTGEHLDILAWIMLLVLYTKILFPIMFPNQSLCEVKEMLGEDILGSFLPYSGFPSRADGEFRAKRCCTAKIKQGQNGIDRFSFKLISPRISSKSVRSPSCARQKLSAIVV